MNEHKNINELVGRIQYRPWKDREIKWIHEYAGEKGERWSAWYNGDSIGSVVCELSKHWEGYYAFMHSSCLAEFPPSVEEGKKWIETLFWAWIRRASEDIPAEFVRSTELESTAQIVEKREAEQGWKPIETAPKDGKTRIIIAKIANGEIIDIDFDAILEEECESWEIPQPYWVWKSAFGRVEDPTHWMLMPKLPTESEVEA